MGTIRTRILKVYCEAAHTTLIDIVAMGTIRTRILKEEWR